MVSWIIAVSGYLLVGIVIDLLLEYFRITGHDTRELITFFWPALSIILVMYILDVGIARLLRSIDRQRW